MKYDVEVAMPKGKKQGRDEDTNPYIISQLLSISQAFI